MKRFIYLSIATIVVFTAVGCKSLKKVTDKVSTNDVKNVADLIDMSFGNGANGPFEVSKVATSDAVLIIKNDTDRTITVKATGNSKKTFTVASGKSDSAQVKPGQYHFVATAPKTNGCSGDAKLEGFNQYKWIFVIKK